MAKSFVSMKVPRAYRYLVTTFFYPAVRKQRTTLVPPILRPVAQRVTGLRDLQWFADASTYPTLGQAARELRMGAATLVTAVGRLERELGGRLLIRAERGRPMRLTPLGAEVAAAVNACRA